MMILNRVVSKKLFQLERKIEALLYETLMMVKSETMLPITNYWICHNAGNDQ